MTNKLAGMLASIVNAIAIGTPIGPNHPYIRHLRDELIESGCIKHNGSYYEPVIQEERPVTNGGLICGQVECDDNDVSLDINDDPNEFPQ